MTADPDVLGLHDEVDRGLVGTHPPPLPAPPGRGHGDLVGVVSLRDLLSVAQIRPAERGRAPTCPAGSRAWWWPRPRWATSAASRASTTTGSTRPSTWPPPARSRTSGTCSSTGRSPTAAGRPTSPAEVAGLRDLPPGLAGLLPALAAGRLTARRPPHRRLAPRVRARAGPQASTSTAASCGPRPSGSAAVVPTILAAVHRLRQGRDPVAAPAGPPLRRQLPVDAHRPGGSHRTTYGPSSST